MGRNKHHNATYNGLWGMSNGKEKVFFSSLRVKLRLCLIVIMLVSIGTGALLAYQLDSDRVHSHFSEIISGSVDRDGPATLLQNGILPVLTQLKRMVLISMGFLFCIALGGLFYVNVAVLRPLEETEKCARRFVEGQLDRTVPIRSDDEIGAIGQLMNDLAVNLQEVLLFTWNITDQCIGVLDRATSQLHLKKQESVSVELLPSIERTGKNLRKIRSMLKSFDLFDVNLKKGKALTIDEHDHGRSSG
jgi:HAMP domain-containing protein